MELMAIYGNFWNPFGNFWQLLRTYGNVCQRMATFGYFSKLVATLENLWQFLATIGKCRQPLKPLKNFGNFGQLLANFGNFSKLNHFLQPSFLRTIKKKLQIFVSTSSRFDMWSKAISALTDFQRQRFPQEHDRLSTEYELITQPLCCQTQSWSGPMIALIS